MQILTVLPLLLTVFCAITLLIISFFIMFAASKTDSKKLYAFGNALGIFMIFFAGLLTVFGVYLAVAVRSPIMR